jgi:PAS domain S-box-containing protein
MIQAADEGRVAPHAVGKYLAQIAIVFAVQFAAGKLGDALAINSGGIGPVWPASGIALAALLLFGYQVWPGVVAGAFLLAFLSPLPHIAAAVYAAGTTLAALTGMFLLRRVVNFCTSLSRLRDALGLIVFGAFGSSLVSASIGVSLLYTTHVRGWSGFGSAWLIYWLGDSMGVLLVTPLVLTFPNLLRIRSRVRIAEFTALLLFVTVACFIVFGDLPLIPVRLHVLAFAVLPFVMWAAIRFGVSGATLSTFFVAAIATVATVLGSGPFAKNSPFTNAVLLDVFFAVLSVSGMTLAAVIAEREEAERGRERLVRERAEAEARLRFAAIVESSEDAIISGTLDGIIISWNAGAQRMYGYTEAEAVGKLITILAPPELPDEENKILETLKAGSRIEHFETIRVTKTGRKINVSLTISPIKDSSGKTVGISGIARDITERKLAEEALRESEEKFRSVFRDAGVGMVVVAPEGRFLTANKAFCDCLGYTEEELCNKTVQSVTLPEDWPAFSKKLSEALTEERGFQWLQKRCIHKGGRIVWTESSATLIRGREHLKTAQYLVAQVLDITQRKLAEAALANVSRKLIEAQEQERTRIARELHDDIGQRLALLAIELEQLQQNPPNLSEVRSRMGKLWKQTSEIATDIQSLSHELHSSRLEYVGVAAAMRGFCQEFGEQQKVEIDFKIRDLPTPLSPDISLCLFRVLQEALHNSAKHSGVRRFEVQLWGMSGEIHLTVGDSGSGFDREAAKTSRGLGLISMEERLKLVKGTLSIESQLKRGTTIHARVPLGSGSDSMRAAG